jgi:type IV secretory pathway VirD2 relaxase
VRSTVPRRIIRDSVDSKTRDEDAEYTNISMHSVNKNIASNRFGNHNSMDDGVHQKYKSSRVAYEMKPKMDLKFRGEALLSKKQQNFEIKKRTGSHMDSLEDLLQSREAIN